MVPQGEYQCGSDAVPARLSDLTAEGTGWTCTVTGQQVTYVLAGGLAPGADASPVTVSATVEPAAYPGVTNIGTVTSSTPDTTPENNTDTDVLPVPVRVDLAITKKADGTFQVGERGTYTLTVGNDGPTEAPGTVTVTDVLPSGLSFVEASGPGWTCAAAGQDLTCTRAGLAVGESSEIVIVAEVLPAAYPSVTNVATVGSDATDIDPENNTGTVVTPVSPDVNLSVDKKLLRQSGRRVIWGLTVTNTGSTQRSTRSCSPTRFPRS